MRCTVTIGTLVMTTAVALATRIHDYTHHTGIMWCAPIRCGALLTGHVYNIVSGT